MTYGWLISGFMVALVNLVAACYSAANGKLYLTALNVICAICIIAATNRRQAYTGEFSQMIRNPRQWSRADIIGAAIGILFVVGICVYFLAPIAP